jgi:hypothetical protein
MDVILPATTISLHKFSPSSSPSPLAFAWRRKLKIWERGAYDEGQEGC